MSESIYQIIESFCEAYHPGRRYETFIAAAEAAGYPQITKVFRAVVAADETRVRLLRRFLPNHMDRTNDYYICPHCGLVFEPDPPQECPVDQTLPDSYIRIS